jgi:hypothetical protein
MRLLMYKNLNFEGPPFCLPRNVILLQYDAADTQDSIVFFTKNCVFLSMVFPGRRGKHILTIMEYLILWNGAFKCIDINFRLRVEEQWGKFILLDSKKICIVNIF